VSSNQEFARAAGRLARKWLPAAKASGRLASQSARQWAPSVKQSGLFFKHVVPAAAKPIHSLWHEVLGFVFLVFAGMAAFKIWHHPGALPPMQLILVSVFAVVMAAYGISSIRKARRISRS
jgi:hypothetical protein